MKNRENLGFAFTFIGLPEVEVVWVYSTLLLARVQGVHWEYLIWISGSPKMPLLFAT